MIGYKLVHLRKNGTLGPLFINRKQVFVMNEYMTAGEYRTKGFAFRPGFHVCSSKSAPHLSKKGRIWVEVEIEDYETIHRPESQGGIWYIAKRMKILRKINSAGC